MSPRRMLPFILINIVVSAVVVLSLLFWWDSRQPDPVVPPSEATAPDATATTPLTAGEAGIGGPSLITPAPPQETADDGLIRYSVQPGDTLGTISAEFDVPLTDLMAANELEDDLIFVGQELIIPVGGLPSPTPVPVASATPNVPPTPIINAEQAAATFEPGEVQVEITDITGVGQLADETVTITNLGSQPVDLTGWTLTDEAARSYTFGATGQVRIFGDGAAILLHSGSGINDATDLYWGETNPVWQPGETATLLDATGTLRAVYTVR